MEYPGSIITRRVRLATLILFITAFILITPTVILYSAGYRFDFKNGLLLETGSLSVDVLPEAATVYLDGLKIDQTMPVRLNNITPHKYTIKISAPGYYDWEKQIEIYRNKTTYIKEFFLLKKAKPTLISTDDADQLTLSSSGRYLAFTVSRANETDVYIRDEVAGTRKLITKIFGEASLSWSPQHDYLAIGSGNSDKSRVSVVNVSTGNITEVHRADPILKHVWGDASDTNLYYSTRNGIYAFSPLLRLSNQITTTKFLDWHVNNDTLWTMEYSTSTLEINILRDSIGFKDIFSSFSTIGKITSSTLADSEIVTIKNDTVLLRNESQKNFFIIRPGKQFAVNADKYFFSKFNNWWLFWSEYELWTYSEDSEPFLLNRSGVKFENILPLDEFNTLAMLRDGEISALFPYFYLNRSLVEDGAKTMAVNPIKRILYFSNDEGIWKLNY